MKLLTSEKGITLIELLIAISLILFLIATLLPSVIQFRQREINWRQGIQLEQEAIRFFTYLENRNANVLNWTIDDTSIIIEVKKQRDQENIKRYIYKNGSSIIERDTETGGNLILAQMVHDITFIEIENAVQIELILSVGEKMRVFRGFLSRGIDI